MSLDYFLNRAKNLCVKREYSTGQIRKKFVEWGIKRGDGLSKEQIDSLLEVLQRGAFIDDLRYSRAYIRDKAKFSNWGERKIVNYLSLAGVADYVIKEAISLERDVLSGVDVEAILQKRWSTIKGDSLQQKRVKLLRYGISRGFDYNRVMNIVDKFK